MKHEDSLGCALLEVRLVRFAYILMAGHVHPSWSDTRACCGWPFMVAAPAAVRTSLTTARFSRTPRPMMVCFLALALVDTIYDAQITDIDIALQVIASFKALNYVTCKCASKTFCGEIFSPKCASLAGATFCESSIKNGVQPTSRFACFNFIAQQLFNF